ncbi:hypothetical protein Bca4012_009728 [Brassica carinata]
MPARHANHYRPSLKAGSIYKPLSKWSSSDAIAAQTAVRFIVGRLLRFASGIQEMDEAVMIARNHSQFIFVPSASKESHKDVFRRCRHCLRLDRSAQFVVARLLSFWDSRNIKKQGEFMGITLLFLDEQILYLDLYPGPLSLLHSSGSGKPWLRLNSTRPCPLDARWTPYDLY